MQILNATLHRYKRFTLLGEETLSCDFSNNKVIIVKGRNGAGKSSFFHEMTPLPADRKDYHEGGYKTIELLFGGKHYILESNFENKTPKYSFQVDGEELNDAGIVTTQRLLTYQHFGITKDLHEIMIGLENFTDMSIGARKKLFTSLTKLNIDQVLRNYDELRSELKLAKHMHANTTKQYQIESTKLQSEEEFKELVESKDSYQSQVNLLLSIKQRLGRYYNEDSGKDSYNDLRELIRERDELISNNYTLLTSHPRPRAREIVDECNVAMGVCDASIKDLLKDLEELMIRKKEASGEKLESPDELNKRKKKYEELIETKIKHLPYLEKYSEVTEVPNDLQSNYYSVINNAPEIADTLVPNMNDEGEYLFSKVKLEKAIDRKKKLVEAISELTSTITHHKRKLEKAEEHTELLTCKACGEKWKLVDLINLEQDNASIEEVIKRRTELEEELARMNRYETDCLEYFRNYTSMSRLIDSTSLTLGEFWNDVKESESIVKNPKHIQHYANKLVGSMDNLNEIVSARKEIEKIEHLLLLHSWVAEDNLSMIDSRIDSLNESIRDGYLKLEDLQSQMNTAKRALDLYDTLETTNNVIERTKERVRDFNISYLTSELLKVIDEQILSRRLQLSNIETLIRTQENITYNLKQQQESISDQEENIRVLEAMIDELSPKNGIIAKTISSFLNTIINNINMTLSRIWSYEMVLEPIDLNNSDLNYKFRLTVEGTASTDDISLASKGQKEAINLAFKLVMYKLLNFGLYPLYLDELASNMDEIHTENMSRLVHSFATESNFSQIFIISHKENMGYLQDPFIVELS